MLISVRLHVPLLVGKWVVCVRASEHINCKRKLRCDKRGRLMLHEGREKEGIIREKVTMYLTRGNLHELKRESAKRFECAGGCELEMRKQGKEARGERAL